VKLLVTLAAVLVLAACGSGGTATGARGTVDGRVLSAPSCPVQRAGQPCPPRPVVGGSVVALRGQQVVATTHTDAGGRFTLTLQPGRYLVRATNTGGLQTIAERATTVTARATSHVRLVVDSGIR
jgi:hypothetical protein